MSELEEDFPGLVGSNHRMIGPPTKKFNCIAWAVGDPIQWMWPVGPGKKFWPPGIPREETLPAFEALFLSLDYESCPLDDRDSGYERIAVFASADGVPVHAARQVGSGPWTSKLGNFGVLEHELHALEGEIYGKVVRMFRRFSISPP